MCHGHQYCVSSGHLRLGLLALAISVCGLLHIPAEAASGYVIEYDREAHSTEGMQSSTDTNYYTLDYMRVDASTGPSTLIDLNRQVMWILDHEKRVATRQDIRAMAAQMDGLAGDMQGQLTQARSQMQDAMSQMSADEQAMMMQMLGGESGALGGMLGETHTPTNNAWTATGQRKTVHGYDCAVYSRQASVMSMTECRTEHPPTLLRDPAFIEISKRVAAAFQPLRQSVEQMAGAMGISLSNMDYVGGAYTVEMQTTTNVMGMQSQSRTVFRGVEKRTDIADTLFAVPRDYRQETMQDLDQLGTQ